jgi:pimeloyl-ACP methyl ester carboxylesterase
MELHRGYQHQGGEMPDVQTDLRIHDRVVGDAPPVVWHTGGCGDGRMWELGGYLAGVPGFTHVVLDHRGRGLSEASVEMSAHHMVIPWPNGLSRPCPTPS